MSRQIGTFAFSSNFEVQIKGSIDARQIVDDFSDLLLFTEDDYIPEGLPIVVKGTTTPIERGLYICVDENNLSQSASWMKIGSPDGQGSGLDADYLDGLDSTDFVKVGSFNQSIAGTKDFTGIITVPNATAGTQALNRNTGDLRYEPKFTKNTAFNKNFGTASGTVAQGNDSRIINGQTAYGWGDHATEGYLKSFTETDPTVPSHVKSITTTEKSNWNTAYSWGNHASAGYLVSSDLNGYAQLAANQTFTGTNTFQNANHLRLKSTSLDSTNVLFFINSNNVNRSYIGHGSGQNTDFYIHTYGTDAIRINTNSSERVRIDSTGNVGIGTSTPSELLEVAGRLSSNFSSNSGMWYGGESGDRYTFVGARIENKFRIYHNGADRFVVDNLGNVGIGTTSPAEKLHVLDTANNAPTARIEGTTDGARSGIRVQQSTSLGANRYFDIGIENDKAFLGIGGTSASLPINSGLAQAQIVIDRIGDKVGIGTSSPSERLTVDGTLGVQNGDIEINGITSYPRLRMRASNLTSGELLMRQTPDWEFHHNQNRDWFFAVSGVEKVRISSAGTITATGDIISNSDRKLKENIKKLDSKDTLQKVVALSAKRYNLKSDKNKVTKIGYIAQDVEKVFPEYVHKDKKNIRSVDYQKMVAVMGESIKELHKEIESLKQRLN